MELKKFTVTAPSGVTFRPPARLGLSEAQVARRAHMLAETDTEGVYEVIAPTMFKVGEELMADPDMVSKAQMAEIAESDTAAAIETKKKTRARKSAADKKKAADAADKKATEERRRKAEAKKKQAAAKKRQAERSAAEAKNKAAAEAEKKAAAKK